MKAFVVCAALLASAAQAEVPHSIVQAAVRAKWSSFKAQHNKEYSAPAEENRRMAKFLSNTRFIEEHNERFHKGLESFQMGHNEMSDMSLDEIMSTRMGVVVPPNAHHHHHNVSLHSVSSEVAAPAAVDWRNDRCVQRVKHQGSCGSCYTFSALGALETSHCRRNRGALPDLAEQYLVDCAGRGCQGGWMHEMFDYMSRNGGVPAQQDYAYTGLVGRCDQNKRKAVRVDSHKRINAGDERGLMQALSEVGTISIAYNAGTQQHSYYRGGILNVPGCGNTPTHAVLLVGYGSENGQDFWILKNSWGESWGEQGYFRLARGSNMCGIADWASYPTAA